MVDMLALVDKNYQLGDLVYDPFADSHATGRAWLSLPLKRRCILGDNDVDCNTYEMRQLARIFASQLLRPQIRHYSKQSVGRCSYVASENVSCNQY